MMVIGPDRRERLIARYADGLSLRWGMTTGAARRYAAGLVDEAVPVAVLAVGQTWTQRDGEALPGGDLFRFAAEKSYTVTGFTEEGLVSVGDGKFHMNPRLFANMWLTAWPDHHTLIDEPQAPAAALPPPEEEETRDEGTDDEGQFDPRNVWVTVSRADEAKPVPDWLPLLGDDYRAVNWRKPEYPPSYGNALDVPAYLDKHLADYRAGWPDFRDQFKTESWLDYFNEMGGCDCDIAVAAYLGQWLWQRVRSDVVAEYRGTVKDYDVMFMWGPYMADAVLEAAPYAHPEWEIPADHRLAQCEGQTSLMEAS
jgi:hypothetical protein